MPSQVSELIKSRIDIVDFLRGYITLVPAGKNFKALCPFHHEKTPSFMVSPERESWHCFGCNIGGDIFGFLMRYENIEFGEALRILAERANVELRRENPAEYRYAGLLYDLNEQAEKFFVKALGAAQVAREYLVSRGLAASTIEEFGLGWAPNDQEALSMNLLNSGASPQDIIQAGLSVKTERGLMLDRFRGRIMFPIHNHQGKVVGFTGRILPQIEKMISSRRASIAGLQSGGSASGGGAQEGTMDSGIAKYVNSPETPIFQKSKVLYGFFKSKDAVRDSKSALLVEGQMDFLMSYQSGVRNAVASSGTALTNDHLRVLRRLAEELIVSFDNDSAGMEAAERAIDLAEANDFGVRVATLPKQFKDAADAVKADPDSVKRAVRDAVPAPVFYFRKYLPEAGDVESAGADGADEGLASGRTGTAVPLREKLKTREGLRSLRAVLSKLKNISSPVEREEWFRELSARTGIAEIKLEEEAERMTGGGGAARDPAGRTGADARMDSADPEIGKKEKPDRYELIVEELLSAALDRNDFSVLDDCVKFLDPAQKEILRLLKDGKRKSEDPSLDEKLGLIVLRASGDVAHEEMERLKDGLKSEFYKRRREELALAVKNAEARGNQAELEAALKELSSLPRMGE